MTLGQQLKIARHKRGWTQQALANRIGMALPTIWCLENDRTDPSFSTVLKVMAELGTTLEFSEGGRLVTVSSSGRANRAAKVASGE